MKRKDAVRKELKKAEIVYCKGCNAYANGINKGIAIADLNPACTCVCNVAIQDLSDERLEKFKKDCRDAYDNCIEEMNKRKLYC